MWQAADHMFWLKRHSIANILLAKFRPHDRTLYRAHSLRARITAQCTLPAECQLQQHAWEEETRRVTKSRSEHVKRRSWIHLSLFGKPETWSVHQHQHRGNVLGGLTKGGRARLLGLLCDLCQWNRSVYRRPRISFEAKFGTETEERRREDLVA